MTEDQKPNEASQELREFVSQNIHKVRACEVYQMEYSECKSPKGRFQQYYLFGETLDCNLWKEDLENCKKSAHGKDKDLKAIVSIIQHENERLEKRMKAHVENDVWEKRSKPPPDWDSKLPDWLQKRQEYAFPEINQPEGQLCVIS